MKSIILIRNRITNFAFINNNEQFKGEYSIKAKYYSHKYVNYYVLTLLSANCRSTFNERMEKTGIADEKNKKDKQSIDDIIQEG